MIPIGRRQCQLEIFVLRLWNQGFEVIELICICAADVLDLSRADDGLPRLVSFFGKCGDIWNIYSRYR